MYKPHRHAGMHPAYHIKGVSHHKHMEHHPGKTSAHPHNPHEGMDAQGPMSMVQGTGPAPMAPDTDQDTM